LENPCAAGGLFSLDQRWWIPSTIPSSYLNPGLGFAPGRIAALVSHLISDLYFKRRDVSLFLLTD
jgi:hypothetical protein